MPELELSQTAQHWTNIVLIWIGFGIVAGLLARLLLPGREPAGAAGTLVIGVLGSTLGPFVLSMFLHDANFNPIGPRGLLAAVGGSLVALVAYRLIARRRTTAPDEDYEE
ncbi:MAG: GlsB/YeaQ/YmgE family stress response membrane protein [Thermoguttaceae bacterium]